MKEPLEDIEAELRSLRPGMPGPNLGRRIEAQLEGATASPEREHSVRWRGWALLVAAAIFLVLWAISPRLLRRPDLPTAPHVAKSDSAATRASGPRRGSLQRVSAADYLLKAEDAGVVYTSATTGLRKIHYQFLSTAQWQDERDNVTVEVIVPGEETVLVPLRVH